MMQPPRRGFDIVEYELRVARAQKAMHAEQLDGLLLTTEAEVRYFSGFQTQFWESPTRPWFLILPAKGEPIAVIPGIGEAGMRGTWIRDIRCWPAPRPEDDGVSLLADGLNSLPRRFGRIGLPMGHESLLRMPLADFRKLERGIAGYELIDAAPLMHALRFVKSAAEINKIEYACQVTSKAFEALPEKLAIGMTEREACQALRMDLLKLGADHSPYLIAGSGSMSYGDIIMGPTDRVLEDGDVLIIDTGTVYDGYFCDFDRNLAFGTPADETLAAHECVHRATDAGFAAARPGATMADLFNAMWQVLEAGGALGNNVGRMGHGLGMQLTEGPSVTPHDQTVLEVGCVVTLEPGMCFAPGCEMVHEENIVITENGARWLSNRAPVEMPRIIRKQS
ncbi:M24 family metallopeptidase [Aestuariispira insulae]|uniref:Xaa-Pro aminopeptidase n=1 Tax=Aestuariispira insulae TaxID=1461337 RepID=A0A3D9HB08_9PROT|nr:Xaa-Pro peptidase family protein [Aestuariispira insulae]RED46176.1 Xaa-Pro aminopeptidase [Aestuariispira insulae]